MQTTSLVISFARQLTSYIFATVVHDNRTHLTVHDAKDETQLEHAVRKAIEKYKNLNTTTTNKNSDNVQTATEVGHDNGKDDSQNIQDPDKKAICKYNSTKTASTVIEENAVRSSKRPKRKRAIQKEAQKGKKISDELLAIDSKHKKYIMFVNMYMATSIEYMWYFREHVAILERARKAFVKKILQFDIFTQIPATKSRKKLYIALQTLLQTQYSECMLIAEDEFSLKFSTICRLHLPSSMFYNNFSELAFLHSKKSLQHVVIGENDAKIDTFLRLTSKDIQMCFDFAYNTIKNNNNTYQANMSSGTYLELIQNYESTYTKMRIIHKSGTFDFLFYRKLYLVSNKQQTIAEALESIKGRIARVVANMTSAVISIQPASVVVYLMLIIGLQLTM